MPKTAAQPKIVYHEFFCDDVLSEFDGFFEIVNGKVRYVTGWFCNDAQWRGEYMGGLISHLGGDVQPLPDEHYKEARALAAKAYGIEEDDGKSDGEGEREEASLEFREGTSDKVYNLTLFKGDNDHGWYVEALYGRRGSNLRLEIKCDGEDYMTAKKLYDKVLNEKLKKGYKHA